MALTLKSNDGQSFPISKALAFSKFLQSQLEAGKSEVKVEIRGDALKLVVDYLTEYSGRNPSKIPEVLKTNDLSKELSDQWDINFITPVTYEVAFHLINAAIILELEHLHDLACAKIAAFMKGKTVDQVNQEFTIECQLTQEEAKELGLEGGEGA